MKDYSSIHVYIAGIDNDDKYIIKQGNDTVHVSGYKVVTALVGNMQISNAILNTQGFTVDLGQNGGTIDVIVNMDKAMKERVRQIVSNRSIMKKNTEDQKKQIRAYNDKYGNIGKGLGAGIKDDNGDRAPWLRNGNKKPVARARNTQADNGNRVTVRNTPKAESIQFRGYNYLSLESLCKAYNTDVNEFKRLYAEGQSMNAIFGFEELKPADQVKPRNNIDRLITRDRILDRMDKQREKKGDMQDGTINSEGN